LDGRMHESSPSIFILALAKLDSNHIITLCLI
jgi:hypothetical protein